MRELFLPKSFVGVERLSYFLNNTSRAFNAVKSSRLSGVEEGGFVSWDKLGLASVVPGWELSLADSFVVLLGCNFAWEKSDLDDLDEDWISSAWTPLLSISFEVGVVNL